MHFTVEQIACRSVWIQTLYIFYCAFLSLYCNMLPTAICIFNVSSILSDCCLEAFDQKCLPVFQSRGFYFYS